MRIFRPQHAFYHSTLKEKLLVWLKLQLLFYIQLSNNAESIKKLHAKILTTSAAQKDQTDQNRVDDLVAENKRLGPSISKALKAEAESLKDAGGYKEGQKLGVEMRMKKKILSENTQRFKEEIGNFYNEMDEYK